MARKSSARRERSKRLDRLAPFEDDCVMVVIETPKGSPNKLAFEPRHETFVLKGVEMKGKRFRVKGQAGKNRALTLVKAAMKRRGR